MNTISTFLNVIKSGILKGVLVLAFSCLFVLPVLAQTGNESSDEETYEMDDLLDTVRVFSREEAREFINGFFNLERLSHAVQARNALKDAAIESAVEGFTDSMGMDVVTYPYITGDSFWSNTLRRWAEAKYRAQKNSSSSYLSNEVVFSAPANSPPGNYSVRVNLLSKNAEEGNTEEQHYFEVLNQMANHQHLEGITFDRPRDARPNLVGFYQYAFGQIPTALENIGSTAITESTDSTLMDSVDSLSVDSLIIEGISRNTDLVAINTITDTLDPGIDRLMITYTLMDSMELDYNKLEIYKLSEEDTTMITFYTGLAMGEEVDFEDPSDENKKGWSAKGTDGEEIEDGDYLVKLTASIDGSYANGYEDYETTVVAREDISGTELEAFEDDAEDGIEDGESWNPNGYACNNAVRSFLYHHKSDPVLFPETMPGKADDFRYGSGLEGPNDNTVLKGDISWDGTADKMFDDFNGNGNDLTGSFTEIEKNSTENWKDYFERLQEEANKGTVIVGVVHSSDRTATRGHIVALMPKSLCSGDQIKANDVGEEEEDDVKRPCALEAGGGQKEITWFKQNSSELDNYKWFKYDN